MNVGLIKIGARKECSIVISSPIQSPLLSHKLLLIATLGYAQCIMCNTLFLNKLIRNQNDHYSIVNAIKEKKSFRYWLWSLSEQREEDRNYVYDRRHICADCVQVFSGLINDKS